MQHYMRSTCTKGKRRRRNHTWYNSWICLIVLLQSFSYILCSFTPPPKPGNQNEKDSELKNEIELQGKQKAQNRKYQLNANNTRTQKRLAMQQSWSRTFKEIRSLTVKPTPIQEKDEDDDSIIESSKGDRVLKQKSIQSIEKIVDEKKFNKTKKLNVLERWKNKPYTQSTSDWEMKLQRWTERASDYFQNNNLNGIASTNLNGGSNTKNNNYAHKIKTQQNKKSSLSLTFPVDLKPASAKPGEAVLPHTDIADKSKRIWIVTTAALPWMTGTAVNPMLRAAYLSKGRKEAGGSVTIMVPWVENADDRIKVYGEKGKTFQTMEDQEVLIKDWLENTADMKSAAQDVQIKWYPAWHNSLENSVYSKGDITALIPEDEVDICVLEEPEHLNWYREAGESWTIKFKHVVGIVHTNYFVYAQEQPAAFFRAPGMKLLCSWMIRAHCHRAIKLSGTLGTFTPEKELVENVHGVRKSFLDAGEKVRKLLVSKAGKNDPIFSADATPTVYFLGKMLWSKGLASLMSLLKYAEESADLRVKVDMYGGGPDKDQAVLKSVKMGLDMPFHGPIDHAALADTHKIFINPSTSEVLCTAVAEALAMGKFVVLPSHPSNDFFAQFPNCLPYANKEEFVGNLYYAMTHAPEPLSEEYAYVLSWEAATERFEAAGAISVAEANAYAAAVNTSMADAEITFPPLIEDEERRRKVTAGLRLSRSRFRTFRSKLAEEIQESKVFPKSIEQRIVSELEKRLELDLDELVNSPRVRLQLSPAELDAQLLELYNSLSQGPGGEAIRSILGGEYNSKQNLKIKRTPINPKPIFSPQSDFFEEFSGQNEFVPEEWVKKTLKKNFPSSYDRFTGDSSDFHDNGIKKNPNGGGPKMNLDTFRLHSRSRSRLNAQQWGVCVRQPTPLRSSIVMRPMSTNLKMKCR